MLAHAVIIVKHLFVCSHVEFALKPVQVTELDLALAKDCPTHLDRVARLHLLGQISCIRLVPSDRDFTV